MKSTYSPLVRNVFNTFPTSQIVWILYDDICERPLEVIRGLYKCLGADSRYTPDTMDQLVNYADSSESGKKNISDRNRLLEQVNCRSHLDRDDLQSEVRGRVYRRFFKEDIRKLEELLGVELAKWKPEI